MKGRVAVRIAQVAPLHEAVPPKLYGGTERVVSFLTEELVALGHEVTLFASGDSRTAATLVPSWPLALRLDPAVRDTIAPHMLLMEQVRQRACEFDLIGSVSRRASLAKRDSGLRGFLSGLHDAERNAGGFGESGATGDGGNGLLVATAATKKIAEFAVLSAEARGRLIGFEAPHTSDPPFDAAVILLEPVVQISARPVPDRPSERGADCPG
jgi:hypothetical protein